MSQDGIGKVLADLYRRLEEMRIAIWEQLNVLGNSFDEYSDTGERLGVAQASFENGVLRVTVKGPPPHRKVFIRHSKLKTIWCYTVADAVRELRRKTGLALSYERALVQVLCWAPSGGEWDPDNVAFRHMVNGLVLARVVPDDSWGRIVLMVAGGVDRERPRVELFVEDVAELPNILQFARLLRPSDADSGYDPVPSCWRNLIIRNEFAPDLCPKSGFTEGHETDQVSGSETGQESKSLRPRYRLGKTYTPEAFW